MSTDPNNPLEALMEVAKMIDDSGVPKPVSTRQALAKVYRHAGVYPVPNLAVSVCEKSFATATAQAMKEGKPDAQIRQAGKFAYFTAMPKLSGASNIRDLIACVGYAMLLNIVSGPEGTRLLYAAQVAHTALTKRPKKRNKSSHTSTVSAKPTAVKSTT